MPIAEHPFDGSWGYQVTGFYAPTSRFGPPDEFRAFVDRCHAEGLGVILDWVPGHFPKDAHGLAFFDGCHLYEHADPRIGEHKEWGTLIFNYSRNEVRNFLVANLVYLVRGVSHRWHPGGCGGLDALPRLPASRWRMAGQRAGRPRKPRGGALPAAGQFGAVPSLPRCPLDCRGIHHLADGDQAH